MKKNTDTPSDKPKDFETHLAELYEFFGPKFDEIDPAEVILSGMARKSPTELSFDQLYALNSHCIFHLKDLAASDQPGKSILIREKVENFFAWLQPQTVEFQILSLRSLFMQVNDPGVQKAWASDANKDYREKLASYIAM